MQWEILLAIILVIGIFTAIKESREKRGARKEKTGEIASEKHATEDFFRKNTK